MKKMFVLWSFSLAVMVGCADKSPPGSEIENAMSKVSATLSSSVVKAAPGQSFPIMWQLNPAHQWYLYWDGLNDSGFPPRVQLDLPPDWKAGPLLWPAPERHLSAGEILDHVYHEKLMLVQMIEVPTGAQIGTKLSVPARIEWLACREECVPGKATMTLEFAVGNSMIKSSQAGKIEAALAAMPVPAPRGAVTANWQEDSIILQVEGAQALEFFPFNDCLEPAHLIQDGAAEGDSLILRLRNPGSNSSLKGILNQEMKDGSIRNWTIDFLNETQSGG